jgi:DNA-binding protein HU-beta
MFLGNAPPRVGAILQKPFPQGMHMNKTDLVAKVQELAELESKAAAERAVSAVLEALTAGLKADGNVALVGFGTFDVKERKARTGVNPATGEKIKIAASKTVGFKAGKALKDEFNKAKAAKGGKKK